VNPICVKFDCNGVEGSDASGSPPVSITQAPCNNATIELNMMMNLDPISPKFRFSNLQLIFQISSCMNAFDDKKQNGIARLQWNLALIPC